MPPAKCFIYSLLIQFVMAKKTKQAISITFPIVNPNAAGIDIGDLIAVAVPGDRDKQSVKAFGAFTEDLFSIAVRLNDAGGFGSHGMYGDILEEPICRTH
jgi:hypothetical protein